MQNGFVGSPYGIHTENCSLRSFVFQAIIKSAPPPAEVCRKGLDERFSNEAKDSIGEDQAQSSSDGAGETAASEAAGNNQERSVEARAGEGFNLTSQTNEQAADQFA